jgi:large subunit ribosomal protein L18e
MKSNTKIEKQLSKKTNSELVETIIAAKKNKNWKEVAEVLSVPRRKRVEVNLDRIQKDAKKEEVVVVPGKVLSQGEINEKIKVVALSFSEKAKEKLSNKKCEISYILEEIKKNPSAKGIKIIK